MTSVRQRLRDEALKYHRKLERDRLLSQIATATEELVAAVPETKAATVQVSTQQLAEIRSLLQQLQAC